MEAGNGLQDRIVAVATALFAEAAFDKVTVQRICELAGVANGSFFRAFATKQALAAGLYGDALRTRDQVVAAALAEAADDAAAAVRSAVRALLGFLTSGSPKARLLRRLREAMSDQSPFQAEPRRHGRARRGGGGLLAADGQRVKAAA
jgi:AcrR family transcriptional regulator